MKNKYLIGAFCICVLLSTVGCNSNVENRAESEDIIVTTVASSEYSQEEFTEERDSYEKLIVEEYSNPIDAYFLPLIEDAGSGVERTQLQDNYRGVWRTEFENVMLWMLDKCVYQEDKDNLLLFRESVESLVSTTHRVLLTEWLDDYKHPLDSDYRNLWGTGTRSGLNQIMAEIYRDASLKLINDTYIYIERDYSLEHYE